ncbi:MAG: cysteine--1-D-myo-inosityl 2-amino-2-deoxy-alpha-D-glucopyranoside ligase, partial [Propionibacterium sp.]|nr:cysteine--1-D-myo-inosityl 2-amino-2-deoxy-alpha-D-glucopyranoside ligase [Propionibacterium sp.]
MYSWAPIPVPSIGPSADVPEQLTLFDTVSAAVVPVGPEDGTARMYVCGITPYDATHLGHANTYLAFDLVTRIWRDLGLDVNYTQNVTDIDDPLLDR